MELKQKNKKKNKQKQNKTSSLHSCAKLYGEPWPPWEQFASDQIFVMLFYASKNTKVFLFFLF